MVDIRKALMFVNHAHSSIADLAVDPCISHFGAELFDIFGQGLIAWEFMKLCETSSIETHSKLLFS